MEEIIKVYHRSIWSGLAITEIGISNKIPTNNDHIPSHAWQTANFLEIKKQFLDYGEHKFKYVWGDGISCLWESNLKRTCYYPWDNSCTAWNMAKLEIRAPIHKIVIKSDSNQTRNLGLKIQASTNSTDWTTLYTITQHDIVKMMHEPLSLFFSDNTKYAYVRLLQENSFNGYDISYIKIFTSDEIVPQSFTGNTLCYILDGSATANGIRYYAPFGMLKSNELGISLSNTDKLKVLWISFTGNDANRLLEEANFDWNNPVFEIKDKTYFQFLNDLATEIATETREKNQFELSSTFMKLLMHHLECAEIQSETHTLQHDYVIRALQFIENHKHESISLCDIAKECQLSEKYLIRIFKDLVGCSPIQYLNKWKMEKARSLLRNTQNPISEIAKTLQFNSSEQFCKFFKSNENCAPSQYRKKYQKQQE